MSSSVLFSVEADFVSRFFRVLPNEFCTNLFTFFLFNYCLIACVSNVNKFILVSKSDFKANCNNTESKKKVTKSPWYTWAHYPLIQTISPPKINQIEPKECPTGRQTDINTQDPLSKSPNSSGSHHDISSHQ